MFHTVFIPVPGWCLTVQLAVNFFLYRREIKLLFSQVTAGSRGELRDIWTQGLDGTAADFVRHKCTLKLGVFIQFSWENKQVQNWVCEYPHGESQANEERWKETRREMNTR
jgi:hypothetical protein